MGTGNCGKTILSGAITKQKIGGASLANRTLSPSFYIIPNKNNNLNNNNNNNNNGDNNEEELFLLMDFPGSNETNLENGVEDLLGCSLVIGSAVLICFSDLGNEQTSKFSKIIRVLNYQKIPFRILVSRVEEKIGENWEKFEEDFCKSVENYKANNHLLNFINYGENIFPAFLKNDQEEVDDMKAILLEDLKVDFLDKEDSKFQFITNIEKWINLKLFKN